MIAEKNGITVDTRTAAPARKMIKCPQKTGINLNLQEDRQRDRRTLLIGILAIAALVTVVVNFGVLQQYRRLDKAPPPWTVRRPWTCWSRRCSAMAPSRRFRSPKTP